ncbi:MAG: sulfatase [Phycisphaerales bacterium]|jgi:iduronate 2-sulfatase|nr:sulfatase [Phycisphaerales bacterium]MBT7171552.1 sulfatase [Phycisphaerales bacterium]
MTNRAQASITRRTLLRSCGIALAACSTPAAFAQAAETKPKPKRNVLFLYVDDLRPELNCYGKSDIVSPGIDKLAEMGVVLNKAYCQFPQCMPSRVSTLSGKYPIKREGLLRQLLPKGLPSLPGHFKANGYDAISIGKVYHTNSDDPKSWTKRYTETFAEEDLHDGWCSGYQLEKNKKAVKAGNKKARDLTECVDAPDSAYPDGQIADLAIAELKAHAKSGKPLFLAAGFYRPHLPWAAPKKYWDLYDRDTIKISDKQSFPLHAIGRSTWCDMRHYGDAEVNGANLRSNQTAKSYPVLSDAKQRELIHAYRASVSFVDAQIKRVLDELETLGMAENTTIVLCGDHGWHLGEYKLWAKVTCYEESLQVPMIVAAPGVFASAKSEGLTELVDIYPTVCEMSGLAIPAHVEGTSMVPLLKDPTREWKTAAFSVWAGAKSMRTARYRLTEYAKAAPKGSKTQLPSKLRYELYDYQAEVPGGVNLAKLKKHEPLLKTLLKQLHAGPKAAKPKSK